MLFVITTSPISGVPTAEMVSASPSGSLSFANTSTVITESFSVVAASAVRMGAWFFSSEPPQAERSAALTTSAIRLFFII